MNLFIPSLFIMLCYAFSAFLFYRVHQGKLENRWALGAMVLSVQLHGLLLYFTFSSTNLLDLSIFKVISIYAWLLGALSLIWLWRSEMSLAGGIICIVNMTLVPMPYLFVSVKNFNHLDIGMLWHILSSMAAWTLLSTAFAHAISYQSLFQKLKKKQLHKGQKVSLVGLERGMIFLSLLSFIFLSIALISGAFYINDLFAQHLVHKTVLTGLAWLGLGYLLFSFYTKRLRSLHFVYGLIIIFILLLLGYVLSNIILQFIVNK